MRHEDLRLRRQVHAAPGGHEQRCADLLLQGAQLLRHGGTAVGEGVGDGAQGAAAAELHEDAEAADI
ncbi:MAG: hypothetical protein QM604_03285 [Microbacterium sp.]